MKFNVDDEVEKTTGDYSFDGVVRAAFRKRSGAVRYVVENGSGLLHIFSEESLRRRYSPAKEGDDGLPR